MKKYLIAGAAALTLGMAMPAFAQSQSGAASTQGSTWMEPKPTPMASASQTGAASAQGSTGSAVSGTTTSQTTAQSNAARKQLESSPAAHAEAGAGAQE